MLLYIYIYILESDPTLTTIYKEKKEKKIERHDSEDSKKDPVCKEIISCFENTLK